MVVVSPSELIERTSDHESEKRESNSTSHSNRLIVLLAATGIVSDTRADLKEVEQDQDIRDCEEEQVAQGEGSEILS